MRTLSLADAAQALNSSDVGSFVGSGVEWQYPDPVPTYYLPKDSGAKVGLARLLANVMLPRGPVLVWVTEWGVWPTAEHMDVFDRYRLSHGEARPLADAPVHLFESMRDLDALISIVSLGLFFVWGFEIVAVDRSLAVTVSHDEVMQYRFAPGNEGIVPLLEQYLGYLRRV